MLCMIYMYQLISVIVLPRTGLLVSPFIRSFLHRILLNIEPKRQLNFLVFDVSTILVHRILQIVCKRTMLISLHTHRIWETISDVKLGQVWQKCCQITQKQGILGQESPLSELLMEPLEILSKTTPPSDLELFMDDLETSCNNSPHLRIWTSHGGLRNFVQESPPPPPYNRNFSWTTSCREYRLVCPFPGHFTISS